MQLGEGVLDALEKAAEEEARSKGATGRDKTDDLATVFPPGKSDAACEDDTGSG
jgi:hypothetical protein